MTDRWWRDDDELLAALGGALRAANAVPARFVEVGKAAYEWRTIDAELAELTYDSVAEPDAEPALVRAEPATLRALRFEARSTAITLELIDDTLVGQILPPQPGNVSLLDASGVSIDAVADDLGYFSFHPIPRGSYRLRCRCRAGPQLVTSWFNL